MKSFKKVAIVGVGLIGGSFALALKKRKLAGDIVGVSRHKKTLSIARKMHAIDDGSLDLDIIKDADLLVFSTPVGEILKLAPLAAGMVDKDCIVTDVGSTKQEIVAELSAIFPRYIGSHPLAGSEKRGITNAEADLFKCSLCILTPAKKYDTTALRTLKLIWETLGAKVALLPSDKHDKVLSLVSHLPHLLAFSLIGCVPGEYLRFAAGGLKDTTRIAASESRLWADIFLSNKKNLLASLRLWKNNLKTIESAIKRKDKKLLNNILNQAQTKRLALNH